MPCSHCGHPVFTFGTADLGHCRCMTHRSRHPLTSICAAPSREGRFAKHKGATMQKPELDKLLETQREKAHVMDDHCYQGNHEHGAIVGG
jgi:hypothetical protein